MTSLLMSDWSGFQAMDEYDDDDDVLDLKVDTTTYAVEEDSPETKAAFGSAVASPSIENDADPIEVPAGGYFIAVL